MTVPKPAVEFNVTDLSYYCRVFAVDLTREYLACECAEFRHLPRYVAFSNCFAKIRNNARICGGNGGRKHFST